MTYTQLLSFCELWSDAKSQSDVRPGKIGTDTYTCKIQILCPDVDYTYHFPSVWDESAGCGEPRVRTEIETCTASGSDGDGARWTAEKAGWMST